MKPAPIPPIQPITPQTRSNPTATPAKNYLTDLVGREQPSLDETLSADEYKNFASEPINASLFGRGKISPEIQEHVNNLDALVSKYQLNKDTVLYRGVRNAFDLNGNLRKTLLKAPNFQSTSPNIYRPMSVYSADEGGAVFEIHAPKGTPAYDYQRLSGDNEVLLPRNVQFEEIGRREEGGKPVIVVRPIVPK